MPTINKLKRIPVTDDEGKQVIQNGRAVVSKTLEPIEAELVNEFDASEKRKAVDKNDKKYFEVVTVAVKVYKTENGHPKMPFRLRFFEPGENGKMLFEPQVYYPNQYHAERSARRRVRRYVQTGDWFKLDEREEQKALYASFESNTEV